MPTTQEMWPQPGALKGTHAEAGEKFGKHWAAGQLIDGDSVDHTDRQKALSTVKHGDHPEFQAAFHKAVDAQAAKFKSVDEDRKKRESMPHWRELRDTAHESSKYAGFGGADYEDDEDGSDLSNFGTPNPHSDQGDDDAEHGWSKWYETHDDQDDQGNYDFGPDPIRPESKYAQAWDAELKAAIAKQASAADDIQARYHQATPEELESGKDWYQKTKNLHDESLPHFPADHNEPNELIPSPLLASKEATMDHIARAEVHYNNGACSVHCDEHGSKKMKGSNYFDAQAEANDHNHKFHEAALSSLGKGNRMATKNEAGEQRRTIVAALSAQQDMINVLAAQSELVRKGLIALAQLSGTEDNPHLAALRSEADNNEPVATTDEEARKPDANDDASSLGAAPAAANTEVTPDAGADVQEQGVSAPQDALNKTVDVTAPTPNTDAPNPDAVVDHAPEVLTNPDNNSLPDNSGWDANTQPPPTHVTSAADEKARFFAAMKLAQSRNKLGRGTGDDLTDAQDIVSQGTSIETIASLNQELDGIIASVSNERTAALSRGKVPQRAAGVERTRPSLSSEGSRSQVTSAGPGAPSSEEFGDLG